MVVPTGQARYAVRTYHRLGRNAAENAVNTGKLGQWRGSTNAGLATNARRVSEGLTWYFDRQDADGRVPAALEREESVALPSGTISTRLDVVLENADKSLSGQVLLWDGPDFKGHDAETIAAVFADALVLAYGAAAARDIEVVQGRHQHAMVVPVTNARAQLVAADAIFARM